MKYRKFLGLAAVLVLMGAGCAAKVDTSIEEEGGLNPAGTSPAGSDAGLDTSLDGSASLDGEAAMEGDPIPDIDITGSEDTDASMGTEDEDTGVTDEPVANHVITFDGSSYSSMNLTIDAGDTVTWRNEGSTNFWIASNVHPTHQLLPEFDANRPIAPGGSYSFTFTEKGAWTWHDHLRASLTGTITVR